MRPAGACGHEATDLRSVVPAPIRVLMITSGYPQPGQPHTQQFVKRQAEFLRAAGVEVDGRIGLNGSILQRISQWVASHADSVIVVSEHMRAFLDPLVPVYTIPSGLDFALFRLIPRDEARRHLRLPLDKRLVLWVGKPTNPRKRFPLAQRAMELLNQSLPAELIVGWGVLHADMPYYMNACDALVFTSVQEGS